jgi:hypothetical protein
MAALDGRLSEANEEEGEERTIMCEVTYRPGNKQFENRSK